MTNETVDEEITVDCLHRHVIDNFGGCETNSFEVLSENGKQYLSMTLKVGEEYTNADYYNSPATHKNIKLTMPELVSADSKLPIPKFFSDDVYISNPEDDVIDLAVDFRFSRVESDDPDIWNYITLV